MEYVNFIVAIIGRDNVGKSSLFNLVSNTNKAITSNISFSTTDRQYTIVNHKNISFQIIDTPSIKLTELQKFNIQTQIAIDSANLIYFLVDASIGYQYYDQDIANTLKKMNKLTYLIINKTENKNNVYSAMEFYKLGYKNLYSISTKKKFSINKILNDTINIIEKTKNINSNKIIKNNTLTCMIIGRPNVGKSTFTNAILNENRVVESNVPGTTTDNINVEINYKNNLYIFIDTAGLRKEKKINKNSIEHISASRTIAYMQKIDVALVVIDALEGLLEQDIKIINLSFKYGQSLIFIVNKYDLINKIQKTNLRNNILQKLNFMNKIIDINFISSKNFTNHYKNKVFSSLNKIMLNKNINFSTNKITNIINKAILLHPIPNSKSVHIKFKHAHLGCNKPIKIIMHGKNLKKLSASYLKYLNNFFINHIKLIGTQVFFYIKE